LLAPIRQDKAQLVLKRLQTAHRTVDDANHHVTVPGVDDFPDSSDEAALMGSIPNNWEYLACQISSTAGKSFSQVPKPVKCSPSARSDSLLQSGSCSPTNRKSGYESRFQKQPDV